MTITSMWLDEVVGAVRATAGLGCVMSVDVKAGHRTQLELESTRVATH